MTINAKARLDNNALTNQNITVSISIEKEEEKTKQVSPFINFI